MNQRLLRLVDDGPSPGAAVGDLWAGVEDAQGAWPARDRLESKSDMKRHLRYLASLKLLRTVPGEPFRYALNRNAYVRRELEEGRALWEDTRGQLHQLKRRAPPAAAEH